MRKTNSLFNTILLGIVVLLSQASFAQKTGTFTKTVYGNGDTCLINYYVPSNYNPTNKYKLILTIGGFNIDSILSSPYFLNAIIINANVITNSWPNSRDSSKITLAINATMSTYKIDPDYVYICGLSWAGRYALMYGLINWKRFRGIYAFTPDFLLSDFGAPGSPKYPYSNGKYIPIIIRVGSSENIPLLPSGTDTAVNYRTFIPRLYRRFVDSGAIVNLAIEYSRAHEAPQYKMEYMGFTLLDKLASSYADNDAGISEVSTPAEECGTSYIPVLTIQNKGVNMLKSATINYQVDGGTLHTIPWSGNMLRLQKDTLSLPLQSLTVGAHIFKAYTTLPNGMIDPVPANDTTTVSFRTISKGHPINFTEDFEESTFPPPGWTLAGDGYFNWHQLDSTALGWTAIPPLEGTNLFGGYIKSASCIYFDNVCGDNTGKKYAIRTPQYDFSNVSGPSLSYDFAAGASTDTLAILYSADCGTTWVPLLKMQGTNLTTTTGGAGGIFYPNNLTKSAAHNWWKTNTIDLSSITGLVGQPSIIFSFENISAHASLLYLDNISISGTTGIPVQKQESILLEVYPNPNKGLFNINIYSNKKDNYLLEVKNILGQLLSSEKVTDFSGTYTQQVDLKKFGSGVYIVNLKTQNTETIKKVIVN